MPAGQRKNRYDVTRAWLDEVEERRRNEGRLSSYPGAFEG
jgi:hypothetical protein